MGGRVRVESCKPNNTEIGRQRHRAAKIVTSLASQTIVGSGGNVIGRQRHRAAKFVLSLASQTILRSGGNVFSHASKKNEIIGWQRRLMNSNTMNLASQKDSLSGGNDFRRPTRLACPSFIRKRYDIGRQRKISAQCR